MRMSFCRTGFRNRTARRIGLVTKLLAEIMALVVFVKVTGHLGSPARHPGDVVTGLGFGVMAYWIVGGIGLRLARAVERRHPDPDETHLHPVPKERADTAR